MPSGARHATLTGALALGLTTRTLAARLAPRWPVLAAVVFCLGIEAFKLTGLPAAWGSFWAARLLFGTTPGVVPLEDGP
jgi:hypothetical protein